MSYLFTYFAFLLVDSLYLCQFITCLFLNKVWGDLIVFHNLLRTSFHPEHCGAKNPGLIMAYIAATLNPEILKNFPGPVRVGKKKSGSGRVAGTRQGLVLSLLNVSDNLNTQITSQWPLSLETRLSQNRTSQKRILSQTTSQCWTAQEACWAKCCWQFCLGSLPSSPLSATSWSWSPSRWTSSFRQSPTTFSSGVFA